MLVKTKGLALNYIRYKETSVIAKIFTKELGLQSYIVNGVQSTKANIKLSLLQPLMLLDLVVYHKEKQNIHRISELKCYYPYTNMHTHPLKRAVTTFITELLLKTLHQDEVSPDLYDFLEQNLLEFDQSVQGYTYFHLHFTFEYMHVLGIHPQNFEEFSTQLMAIQPDLGIILKDENLTFYIINLLEGLPVQSIQPATAALLLDIILSYYKYHIAGFGEMKSVKVLREL